MAVRGTRAPRILFAARRQATEPRLTRMRPVYVRGAYAVAIAATIAVWPSPHDTSPFPASAIDSGWRPAGIRAILLSIRPPDQDRPLSGVLIPIVSWHYPSRRLLISLACFSLVAACTRVGPTPTPSPTPGATPSLPSISIVAAGDIACAASANRGSPHSCDQAGTAALIGRLDPVAVLALGDDQYEKGSLSDFRSVYALSWGAYLSKTFPALGNHEYLTPGAAGYFAYFGSRAPMSYYSFNLGAWHLISLNSECSHIGGCGAGSTEESWLRADLAANPGKCTLAYWHEPRWTNGEHSDAIQMAVIWNDLVASHATLVLSGHNHDYERYAPMDANGIVSPTGVREFVVGTGGRNHYAIKKPPLAVEQVSNDKTFGVLQLTLSPGSYAWRFVPAATYTFTDAGTGTC
jgi:hypothetical protein